MWTKTGSGSLCMGGLCAILAVGMTEYLVFAQGRGRIDSPRQRTIPEIPGVPIASRILPDDDIVVVQRFQEIDRVEIHPAPTVSQVIRYATDNADAVLVVAVDRVEGKLTADQSWIETIVGATIRDVLKSRRRRLSQGERITVEYGAGGETTIGRSHVKAGTPFKVSAGREYLMFLTTDAKTRQLVAGSALVVEEGKLSNPWELEPGGRLKSPLHGQPLEALSKEIRAIDRVGGER